MESPTQMNVLKTQLLNIDLLKMGLIKANWIKLIQLICFTLVCFMVIVSNANAKSASEETRNPIGCHDAGYQFELKTLSLLPGKEGAQQTMYFMFNPSPRKVILYQMHKDESARSVYLNHVINPNQWAVLATSNKEVRFICAIQDPNKRFGKIVDCASNLRVCEYIHVRYGLNNRGNYWIVNNNTRGGAIADVIHYGIIPAER